MDNLNAKQQEAVRAVHGPVLIVAGPGTGKTKTLTARMAHLLDDGTPASRILALTFTIKAAQEMTDRLAARRPAGELPAISTFHSLGHRILRRAGAGETFEFISEGERLAIIRQLPRPHELRALSVRELGLVISRFKGEVSASDDSAIARVAAAYQAALRQRNLLDYDDLLYRAHQELKAQPALAAAWQAAYDHILIDEFQDTSQLQWELIRLICGTDSVFVIGDPKQSIYGFRGANADMFARFRGDFPDRHEVTLEVNYRSDTTIVSLASAIFGGHDALKAHSRVAGDAQAVRTLNEFSEADYVLARIEEGIGGSDMLKAGVECQGKRFQDFAVLYRTHHAARIVQRRLQESGIPFQVVGEGSPYEEADVQAIVDALGWFAGGDMPQVKDLRASQVRVLLDGIDRSVPVSRLAASIAAAFGLGTEPKTAPRIQQFLSSIVRFDARADGLSQCVAYFERLSQGDFYDPLAEAVTLMTIHASKGLEFPHVMIIGAEEGILPAIRKTKPTDFEEEKRLFYVAATRAQHQLDIIFTQKRAGEPRQVSRFVAELAADVLPRRDDPALPQLQKRLRRREQKARQATLF